MSKENIHTKVFKIMKDIEPIMKSKENSFFKSRYVDLQAIQKTITNLCLSNNVLWINTIENENGSAFLITKLISMDDNSEIQSSFLLPSVTDVQKIGSAITYARRYNISALLNLVATDDNDGQSFNEEQVKIEALEKEKKSLNKPISLEEFEQLVSLIKSKGYEPDFIWEKSGMTGDDAINMTRDQRKKMIKKLGAK